MSVIAKSVYKKSENEANYKEVELRGRECITQVG